MYKYELLGKELNDRFSGPLEGISVDALQEYQSSWKMCPLSRGNKLARLKTIFQVVY